MEFKNLDNLKKWLDDTLKCIDGSYDFDACLCDLIRNHGENGIIGTNDYELSGTETKSGNPELFRYEYEAVIDEDGDVVSEAFTF